MGVKNNFSQAVSELIGISRTVDGSEAQEEALEGKEEISADAFETEIGQEAAASDDQDLAIDKEEEKDESGGKRVAVQASNPKERILAMLAQQQAQNSSQEQTQQPVQNQEQVQNQPQSQPQAASIQIPAQSQPAEKSSAEPAGITTIAKGTVIIGEINAEGDVELLGSLKGKVTSQGDILVNGKVIGDLAGKDIQLTACAVQGNINASGMVTVDGDSVVIGDVRGENFCLDGKIKGNVTVEKEAKFQPKAILAGNVTTASIAMSQGAKIQGEVNIPLSEKETNMSFDVDIII